jgi:hypothetical protein
MSRFLTWPHLSPPCYSGWRCIVQDKRQIMIIRSTIALESLKCLVGSMLLCHSAPWEFPILVLGTSRRQGHLGIDASLLNFRTKLTPIRIASTSFMKDLNWIQCKKGRRIPQIPRMVSEWKLCKSIIWLYLFHYIGLLLLTCLALLWINCLSWHLRFIFDEN